MTENKSKRSLAADAMAKKEPQPDFLSSLKQGTSLLAKNQDKEAEVCFISAWEKAGKTELLSENDKQNLAQIFHLFGRLKFSQGYFSLSLFFLEKSRSFGFESDENILLSARSHLNMGDNENAARLAEKLVCAEQGNRPAQLTQGQALLGLKQFEKAKEILTGFVKAKPEDPEGLVELGLAFEGLEKPEKAQELFDKVKYGSFKCFDILLEDADKFLALNLDYPARKSLIRAEKVAFDDAVNFFYIGLRYFALNFAEDAERCFRKAIQIGPQLRFYRELALLYERVNQPEKAIKFAMVPIRSMPDDPSLNLALAKCESRLGKLDEALVRLEKFCDKTEKLNFKAEFQNRIGSILDKKGRINEAYQAFQASKDILKTTDDYKSLDLETPHEGISGMMKLDLKTLPVYQGKNQNEPDIGQLVFFIGFPRSGTTLIQQILDSHPDIVVAEEKQPIATPIRLLQHFETKYPDVIQTLSQQHINDLRNIYLKEMMNFVSFDKNTTVVDKLPLNISTVPLIITMFPEAKIIFGLRHPYGSCLSCLMQYFQLNNSMANLMSLDEITNLYAKTMKLWTKTISQRKVPFHYVRYENIVQNLANETREMINFLGLEWAPEVLEYAKTAKDKGLITTPSYSQVVQPIYADALEKWRAYEKYFEPYKDRLEPYVRAFGYSG